MAPVQSDSRILEDLTCDCLSSIHHADVRTGIQAGCHGSFGSQDAIAGPCTRRRTEDSNYDTEKLHVLLSPPVQAQMAGETGHGRVGIFCEEWDAGSRQ